MKQFPDLKKFSHLFSTFFGVGLIPIAPGTWGSIAALILFFCYVFFQINFFYFLLSFVLLSIFAVIASELSSKDLVEKDHKAIVIDEVSGAWLSFLFVPAFGGYDFTSAEWQSKAYFIAMTLLVLFRFFDILKPHPISLVDQRFKSGFGIVSDDLIAGVFAGLTLLGGNFFINIF